LDERARRVLQLGPQGLELLLQGRELVLQDLLVAALPDDFDDRPNRQDDQDREEEQTQQN
jgi:hypothetical protein